MDKPLVVEISPDRRQLWIAAAAIGAFALLAVSATIFSKGFLEGDACTHYMIARFSFDHPREMVGVWGRPLVTALYAVPATLGGRTAVRLTSVLLGVICCLVTYRVARNQHYRWPAIAVICLLAQPLFFLHSFSELTELPFATILILAFWAYQRKQFLLMAVLIAISPTARPEGFGFIMLAAAALILHRRWWWLAVLPVPVMIWSYIGWQIWGYPDLGHGSLSWLVWLKHAWPYSEESMYPRGWLVGFLVRMPVVVSPLLFPFLLVGVWQSAGGRPVVSDHRRWCQWLIAMLPLSILAGHSVLWWMGKMASSGELRYMLIVGPFWALLCARGWEWAFGRFGWRRPAQWAAVAALLPLVVNAFWRIVPLPAYDDDVLADHARKLYQADPELRQLYPIISATHPAVYYEMDVYKSDDTRAKSCSNTNIAEKPPGIILVWDRHYGPTNSNRDLAVTREHIVASGWIHYRTLTLDKSSMEIFLSPSSAQGAPPPPQYGRHETIRVKR